MTFEFKPAVRENVHLLVGLAAASGGGKTKSALELAVGLAGGDESKIAFVDTEARRALHYARPPGATPEMEPDKYGFQHADMVPPFHPDRIIEAIDAAEAAGMLVLIIDSMSHEYDGEGGIMEWAADLEEGVLKPGKTIEDTYGDDGWKAWKSKPVKSPGNWKEPKMAHKRMMNRFLSARCHIIFCLRAEEKIRILKKGDKMANGQTATATVVEQAGWMPICEKRFMFEMTVSLILRPDNPGKPNYDLPHKIQDQHIHMFPEGEFITRKTGAMLAAWASPKPLTPIDLYAKEFGVELKKPATLKKWWTATAERRTALKIPAERLKKMTEAFEGATKESK